VVLSTFLESFSNPNPLQGIVPCSKTDVEIDIPLNSFIYITLSTVNDDITFTGNGATLYVGAFQGNTINGNVDIQCNLQANTIYSSSVNGDVESSSFIFANQITMETTNGNINLQQVKLNGSPSSSSFSTTNGDITIYQASFGRNNTVNYSTLNAGSVNGDVSITMSPFFVGTFAASSSNGDVTVQVGAENTVVWSEEDESNKSGTINGPVVSPNSLILTTTNGDATLIFN